MGRDMLRQGIIRRIGNGTTTHIWRHNWLPRPGLMRPITSRVPNPPQYVSELISTTTATWNEALVHTVFLSIDAEAILRIPLCTRNIPDFWAWSGEKKGQFSVKSAYRMILNTKINRENWIEENEGSSGSEHESNAWSVLWKVSLPSKIKLFLWRLARSSVPTADVLEHRNMSTSAACMLCGARDSWRHTLITCSMARSIWALSEEIVEQLYQHDNDSPRDWLFTMNDVLSPDQFERMAITLWAIWGTKRKVVYEDIYQSPLSTHMFIHSYISDLQVLKKPRVLGRQSREARPTQWIQPPGNLAKINVDAAVAGSAGGSVAAVVETEMDCSWVHLLSFSEASLNLQLLKHWQFERPWH